MNYFEKIYEVLSQVNVVIVVTVFKPGSQTTSVESEQSSKHHIIATNAISNCQKAKLGNLEKPTDIGAHFKIIAENKSHVAF